MSKQDCILAIDQGTTGTTVVLVDKQGTPLGKSYQTLTQIYPQPGWVEHDPLEIWQTVLDAVSELDRSIWKYSCRGNHQPERNHSRLGQDIRRTGFQCDCLAVPPDCGNLRKSESPGESISKQDRPAHRCLLQRNQTQMDPR